MSYKKVPTTTIMGSIQLGIANALGKVDIRAGRDILLQDFSIVESTHFPRFVFVNCEKIRLKVEPCILKLSTLTWRGMPQSQELKK